MITIKLPYYDEVRKAIWPSFKISIEEKHGQSGIEGHRGEQNALKLFDEHFEFDVIYDHSEDVVGQLYGVDFTGISSKRKPLTIDAKSGSSSLYYDRNEQYWYITLRDEIFNPRKINTHVIHIGPKGDLFAFYNKQKMDEFRKRSARLVEDKYGQRLKVKDFPDFVVHNFGNR